MVCQNSLKEEEEEEEEEEKGKGGVHMSWAPSAWTCFGSTFISGCFGSAKPKTSSAVNKALYRSMASQQGMHKSEQEFIFNWMNKLRSLREKRTSRIIRCRKLSSIKPHESEKGNGAAASLSTKKRVHWVRHGEGYHNVHSRVWFDAGKGGNPWEHVSCPVDPVLTEVGLEQAKELNRRSELEKKLVPGAVVVSPLRRTLQTATLGFNYLVGSVPFIAQEDCREIMGQHRCDRRIKSVYHKKEYSHVDFSLLHDYCDGEASALESGPTEEALEAMDDTVFNRWGKVRESDEAAIERTLDFLFWLKERPEDDLIVVTHSCWLCVAFNGAMQCDSEELQAWFDTAEIRSTLIEF